VLSLLVLGLWPLRNFIASGNPVMPVPVGDLFAGLSPELWERLKQDAHQTGWALQDLPGNLAAPWQMVFSDWDTLAKEWGAARFIGPFVWMGAPLFVLLGKDKKRSWLIWTYGLVAFFFAISTTRVLRYSYPGLGPLIVIAGAGLAAAWERTKENRFMHVAKIATVFAAALLCTAVLVKVSGNLSAGYAYLRAKGDLESYMKFRANIDPLEAGGASLQVTANRILPKNARLILVGENRFLYLDRPAVAPSFMNSNPAIELLKSMAPEKAAAALIAQGFTHMLVSYPELERMEQSYGVLGLDPALMSKLSGLAGGDSCPIVAGGENAGEFICRLVPPKHE